MLQKVLAATHCGMCSLSSLHSLLLHSPPCPSVLEVPSSAPPFRFALFCSHGQTPWDSLYA